MDIKAFLKGVREFMWTKSIFAAAREQDLISISKRLEGICPDISNQYTRSKMDSYFGVHKVRFLHAFQISLAMEAINKLEEPTIVDIGDSAGTHLTYIRKLYRGNRLGECVSVNLDPVAVEKIKSKGTEAICARAEDLARLGINADVFLCYETLEHVRDPCYFLYQLATKTKCKYLILTVPYLVHSRVGFHYIRNQDPKQVYAEDVHIFELCPEDWKLLARHSGWKIHKEKTYLQYPVYSPWWITKYTWQKYDCLGFYGLILQKDDTWLSRYADW